MIHIARWKIILILIICAMGVAYALPNVVGENILSKVEGTALPHKTVNLGLDLQGGSHLLLEVDLSTVIKERSESLVSGLRPELRKQKIGYRRLADIDGGVKITLRDEADAEAVRKIIRELDRELEITTQGAVIEAKFSDLAIKEIQDQTIDQSIEIVRRRIDETGTREPAIQRQGDSRILVQLPGLDDPQRVKDLLGKTAKLTFHLVDGTGGVGETSGRSNMTLPMADGSGQNISVNRRAEITGDMLVNASVTIGAYSSKISAYSPSVIISAPGVSTPFASSRALSYPSLMASIALVFAITGF